MFKNLFKGKKSIRELAQTAEIYPAMDDGNYKAFIIQIIESNTYFSSVLKKEGESAINVFIEAIESRISNRNFDDPLEVVEKMYGADPNIKKNWNAERIVICCNEQHLLGWTPED